MKYGKEHHRIPTNPEVHGIRKAARNCSSNIVEYNWISLRGSCGFDDSLVYFENEFLAKARTLLVVAVSCIIEFAPRRASENYAKYHRPKRERAEALISSQGTTSSGKASSSAMRRSNSARCMSVRGKALA